MHRLGKLCVSQKLCPDSVVQAPAFDKLKQLICEALLSNAFGADA
jgi:hypothetical protein